MPQNPVTIEISHGFDLSPPWASVGGSTKIRDGVEHTSRGRGRDFRTMGGLQKKKFQ